MKRSIAVAAAMALAGCAGSSNPGPRPDNYKAVMAAYIKTNFFDPYTLRDVAISEPVLNAHWSIMDIAGWFVCLQANGKNRYGAYTGTSQDAYMIKDGVAYAHMASGALQSRVCASLAPWPEMEMAAGK